MCVCVISAVAKGPLRTLLLRDGKVSTKRIYSEYVIRPRLVCKSILIKVLANTPPPVLSQLMRNLFCVSPGPDCKRYLQLIKWYSIRELHQETENLVEPSSSSPLDYA